MDRITKKLAVCNEQKAREVGSEFDRVISLSSEIEHTTHSHLIKDGEHDYNVFESAVECASSGIESGEDVLVHCRAGISRSVSVCIATYVESYDVDYSKAYQECTRGFQNPDANLTESAKRYITENTDMRLI